jgi:hypothetical protein
MPVIKLTEYARPQKIKRSELTQGARNAQKRWQMVLQEDLKLVNRVFEDTEKDIQRMKNELVPQSTRRMLKRQQMRRPTLSDELNEASKAESAATRLIPGSYESPSTVASSLASRDPSPNARRGSAATTPPQPPNAPPRQGWVRGSRGSMKNTHRYSLGTTTGSRGLPALPDKRPHPITRGRASLGPEDNSTLPPKKLWTPKNERDNVVRRKIFEEFDLRDRCKSKMLPQDTHRVTDIVIL